MLLAVSPARSATATQLGRWVPAGPMNVGRGSPQSALLPAGQVLLAGGVGADDNELAEIYDSRTNTFTPTASMLIGRIYFTLTRLDDGTILAAGGLNIYGNALSSAEMYLPDLGRWSQVGNMTTARAKHTATLLADGRVLIAGGGGKNGKASAELYDPAT